MSVIIITNAAYVSMAGNGLFKQTDAVVTTTGGIYSHIMWNLKQKIFMVLIFGLLN